MKALLRKLIALLPAAVLFGACQTPSSGPGGEKGTVQLVYWSSQNPGERRLAEELTGEWNAANPKVQVDVQPLPAGQSSEEVLLASVVAGTTPDICSNIWPGIVSDLVRAGGVVALDRFDDFDEVMAERASSPLAEKLRAGDGHFYQLPWKSNPIMMQYNMRMFREAGIYDPPATYSEYLDAARRISRDLDGDGVFDRWIGYRDVQPIWHQRLFDFYAFYLSATGGRTLFSDGKLQIDTEAASAVFSFFRALYGPGYFPRSKLQSNPFVQREAATDFVGPWNIAWLEENAPPDLEFAFAPLPLPDGYTEDVYTYGDFKNIAVFSTTKHPEEAWRFAKFLTTKKADLRLLEIATQMPIRQNLLSDPFFEDYFDTHPQMIPFASQVERTAGIEDVRAFPEMLDAIAQQYEAAAVYGLRPVQDAVARAVERIREIERWYE